jgi:hypothetical protein
VGLHEVMHSQGSCHVLHVSRHTHTHTHTRPHSPHHRAAIYIMLSRNTSLLGYAPGSIYVRFNTSSTLAPAQITSATTVVATCPPFTRAGPCTGQVVIGQSGAVLAQFGFAYTWPAAEVSPAKLPKSGGTLTLKVCMYVCCCGLVVNVSLFTCTARACGLRGRKVSPAKFFQCSSTCSANFSHTQTHVHTAHRYSETSAARAALYLVLSAPTRRPHHCRNSGTLPTS